MTDRLNALMKPQPGIDVARRSTVLVAASGPYQHGVQRKLRKIPLANVALSGAISTFYVAMTAAPQVAIEKAAARSFEGAPRTPEQVAKQRRMILAGNAATMAAAVLAQRAITHSPRSGPLMDMGRMITSQVAIGAAAGAIVTGTDAVLGPIARRKDTQSPAGIAVAAGIMTLNRRLLKKSARALTLPAKPSPYSYVG